MERLIVFGKNNRQSSINNNTVSLLDVDSTSYESIQKAHPNSIFEDGAEARTIILQDIQFQIKPKGDFMELEFPPEGHAIPRQILPRGSQVFSQDHGSVALVGPNGSNFLVLTSSGKKLTNSPRRLKTLTSQPNASVQAEIVGKRLQYDSEDEGEYKDVQEEEMDDSVSSEVSYSRDNPEETDKIMELLVTKTRLQSQLAHVDAELVKSLQRLNLGQQAPLPPNVIGGAYDKSPLPLSIHVVPPPVRK
jgi:hypothetical protein